MRILPESPVRSLFPSGRCCRPPRRQILKPGPIRGPVFSDVISRRTIRLYLASTAHKARPWYLGTASRRCHADPYISAINAPHVKVMGITGEKAAGRARRAHACHTLILCFGVKSCRKSGGHQPAVQISHTTQLFGLNYWEKRNSLRTIS